VGAGAWGRPGGEKEEGENFFIFFPRNPLKRLDSKKQEKANESSFVFICFCRLLLACRYGAAGRERAPSLLSGWMAAGSRDVH
jgi:hypothetical protein